MAGPFSMETQTTPSFVVDESDILGYLLTLSAHERKRVFSTSKGALRNEFSNPNCSLCSYALYAFSLLDGQGANSASVSVTLPRGNLDGQGANSASVSVTLPRGKRKSLNLGQFSWHSPTLIHLGDALVEDPELMTTFLEDSLSSGAVPAVGETKYSCEHHRLAAPRQNDIDCSLRRLGIQEAQAARLEMFCDLLLDSDPGGDGSGKGAREGGEGVRRDVAEIESLLNENSLSHLEFERKLAEIEDKLESQYAGNGATIAAIKDQISECAKQIHTRKVRLQAAAARHIEEGKRCLLSRLLHLCWKNAFSEYFSWKAERMATTGGAGRETGGKKLQEALNQLKQVQLHREETRSKCLQVELETLQAEILSLRERLQEVDPSGPALEAMPLEKIQTMIDCTELNLERMKRRKEKMLEHASMCCVCWSRKKQVAFKCGHCTCELCADKVTVCPQCRHPIDMRIKLF